MASESYRHLRLRLTATEPASTRYLVTVDGQGRAVLSAPFSLEKTTFALDGDRDDLLTLLRERRISEPQMVRLGTILADLLLPGPLRRRLTDELRIGERLGGLRLLLDIEAPELSVLPWEYVFFPQSTATPDFLSDFLALREKVSLARCTVSATTAAFTPSPRYRLLAAAGITQRDAIVAACAAGRPVRIEPTWLIQPTLAALDEALRDPPAIVHLAAQALDTLAADPARLGEALARAGVRLAVLGLPEGDTPAQPRHDLAQILLCAGVAAVLIADAPLPPAAAGELAMQLYSGIAAGKPLDEAVNDARIQLFDLSNPASGWGDFALYLGTSITTLFPAPGASTTIVQTIGSVSDSGMVIGMQGSSGAAQAAPAPRMVPRMLPSQPEQVLIGRDVTIGQVRERLAEGGKCFLCGALGVGKTSLSVELFRRLVNDREFADGTIWLNAGGLSAEQLLEQIARPFGDEHVAREAGRDARVNQLRALLAQRPHVLIGVDELHDPDAARALLDAAGKSMVILNGSARLDLGGMAYAFELEPLDPADSARLFIAEALLDGQALSPAEVARILELCERARHIPFWVHQVALRARPPQRLPLAQLLDKLLRQIERAPATLVRDDASVIRIFADSFARLKRQSPAAIRMLVRLATFPASEAPETVIFAGLSGSDVFSAPDRLRDYFLVDTPSTGRLGLHPLLSALVEAQAPARMRAQERRAAEHWLLDYAAAHERQYGALADEHRNLLGLLRAFEDAARWDDAAALMRKLFDYLRVRGLWALALEHLDLLAGTADQLRSRSEQGWVALERATIELLQSRFAEAEGDFDRADTAFAAAGDQAGQGVALARRSGICSMRGELSRAAELLRRALELMGTAARDEDRAEAHTRLASILATQGDQAGAAEHYQATLALAAPEGRLRACLGLGRLARQAGDDAAAQARYEEALALAGLLGHALAQAHLEQELGHLAYFQQQYRAAEEHFGAAERGYDQLEYRPGRAQIRHAYGSLAFAAGDLDAAEQRYHEALAINEALGVATNLAYNHYMLGVVAQRRGDSEAAAAHYATAQQAAEHAETQDVQLLAAALYQQAKLAAAQQRTDEAIGLLDRAIDLAERGRDVRTQLAALRLRAESHQNEDHTEQAERDRRSVERLTFDSLVGQVLEAAQRITKSSHKSAVLGAVARALALAGRYDQALAVALRTEDDAEKAAALSGVAQELELLGLHERAMATAGQALAAAKRIDEPQHRAWALDSLAQLLARSGLSRQAIATAEQISDAGHRSMVLDAVARLVQASAAVAETKALTRQPAQARTVAERIEAPETKVALGMVTQALARAGLYTQALAVAEQAGVPDNIKQAVIAAMRADRPDIGKEGGIDGMKGDIVKEGDLVVMSQIAGAVTGTVVGLNSDAASAREQFAIAADANTPPDIVKEGGTLEDAACDDEE